MNRKGFAITTVIYGLTVLGLMIIVILMGLLSSTRNNVSSESKRVEEDLIAYNLASKNYTCNIPNQTHTVPKGESGWYRIEAYSKPVGNINGAYTTGIIYLPEGLVLNICEGGDAIVKYNGTTLMKPIPTTTGSGTLKRYNGVHQNPKIHQFLFTLDTSSNLIGSNGIGYGDGSERSEIYGYPDGNAQAPLAATANGKNVNLYFVDGLMVPSVNEGAARVYITKLADDNIDDYPGDITHENKIPGRNAKYNNVKQVNVEIKSTDVNLQSLSISHQGTVVSNNLCSGSTCSIDFGSAEVNIDDISVLFTSGSYNKQIGGTAESYLKIETVNAGGTVNTLYSSEGAVDANGEKPTVITPTGIKMSAYQPDWFDDDLPRHGNYYIFPVTTESRVWSARADTEGDSNPILAEYLTGEARQKWSIDIISTAREKNDRQVPNPDANPPGSTNISICKIKDNTDYKLFNNILNGSCATEYRIMELTRFKSITIYRDENTRRNTIAAPETFQSLSRNEPQIWNIKTMNDGTFTIKTVVESSNFQSKSGFLAADTNAAGTPTDPIRIMVGTAYGNTLSVEDKKTTQTAIERVKLYAIDFVR